MWDIPEVFGGELLAKQYGRAAHSIAYDPAALSHPGDQLEGVVAPLHVVLMVPLHEARHHSVKGRKRL